MALDSKKVWFGTRDLMQWVKAPATNMGRARRQWESGTGFLNGGQSLLSSNYSALAYTMAWSVLDRETENAISGYFEQAYGDGLLYFSDPFAWDNVMPLSWSAAYLAAQDAPSLVHDYRPTTSPVTINGAKFPTRMANYSVYVNDPENAPDVYVPIPRGYALRVGAFGTSTGYASITVRSEISGGNYASTVPLFSPGLNTIGGRTYLEFRNTSGENDFVRFYVWGQGQLNLVGVHAFITPIDEEPRTYNYFPLGKGNSGLRFEGTPQITGYSSVLDQQAMSAVLVETGAWE